MDVQAVLSQVRQQSDLTYDEIQLEAICTAVPSKVMVLTGGLETEKTTTTMGIISAYRMAGCRIILSTPTGRAAKRMSETLSIAKGDLKYPSPQCIIKKKKVVRCKI